MCFLSTRDLVLPPLPSLVAEEKEFGTVVLLTSLKHWSVGQGGVKQWV